MKNLRIFARCLIGCVSFAVVFILSSCEKVNQKRTYEEVVTVQEQKSNETAVASFSSEEKSPFNWSIPDGWKEKPAGGMRLASFTSETDAHLDVSIVSLSGAAGGVSANINRWLGQLHLSAFNDEILQQFLSKQEKFTTAAGLFVTMVDFSALMPEDNQSLPSMLAAIIQLSNQTVFVKMTGTVGEINKNRELFRELCRSVSR